MKKEKTLKSNNVVIYQTKSGSIELKGDIGKDTIWATQAQIAQIFNIDRSVATKHINSILKDREVDGKSNVQKMHIANSDKPISFYSLDMILAVGYRSNSSKAMVFRQWATKTLRSYIVDGYAINKSRIAKNYTQFLSVVEDIKKLLPSGSGVEAKDALELVSLFADTWLSLDAYDKELLPKGKLTRKKVELTGEIMSRNLTQFKEALLEKKEATDIFGTERSRGTISGIVGNVMQAFGGKEVYPTAEEKAAHLLYFIVKNHPFVDGNKRSGAFAFVWYLKQADILDVSKLTPSALTALTIMVAESNAEHKEKVIPLILNLISKKN